MSELSNMIQQAIRARNRGILVDFYTRRKLSGNEHFAKILKEKNVRYNTLYLDLLGELESEVVIEFLNEVAPGNTLPVIVVHKPHGEIAVWDYWNKLNLDVFLDKHVIGD